MSDLATTLRAAAERHQLSVSAADTLYRALVSGGGGQAQFSHPDLGGMGQWSNGMTQIGDMFNDALKAKVDGFCRAMSATARAEGNEVGRTDSPRDVEPSGLSEHTSGAPNASQWWPKAWGWPASSGAQNGMRYACFPDHRRLAIERDGLVILYDTGPHRLNGFAQQQGGVGSLAFSGQNGPVAVESLTVVDR